ARTLSFGDQVQGQRSFSARLRAVDLGDAALREPADPQGAIEPQRAGRHRGVAGRVLSIRDERHQRSFAEALTHELDRVADDLRDPLGFTRLVDRLWLALCRAFCLFARYFACASL